MSAGEQEEILLLASAVSSLGQDRPGSGAPEEMRPAAAPLSFRLPSGLSLLDSPAFDPAAPPNGNPPSTPSCVMLLGPSDATRRITVERLPHISEEADLLAIERFRSHAASFAPADQIRLLRFLAETCASVFRLAASAKMASFLLRLARDIAAQRDPGAPQARPLTRQGTPALSIWQVPGPHGTGLWHLLSCHGVQRIAPPVGGVLILDAQQSAMAPMYLLPPDCAVGPLLPFAAPSSGLPGLLEAGTDAPQERAVVRALSRRALANPLDPLAGRLLRDRRLLSRPAAPRLLDDATRPLGGALELALSDSAGGVFLSGWLRDPLGLATGLALRDLMTGATHPLPAAAVHRIARPDLAARFALAPHGDGGAEPGFLAHLPDAERLAGGPVVQWGLDLRLASGEAIQLTAPPGLFPASRSRMLVLRSIHPDGLRPRMLDDCLTPAVARLHASALARLGPPEYIRIGTRPPGAKVAIVIPIYRNLRFLRFQLAAFARDVALRRTADLIFVLDSPEQRDAVEHLLRGLHGIYGLPLTLLIMAENAGYASASNAGAAAASPSVTQILLLNSDVVPAALGWLAAMRGALNRKGVFAVGPKLLFEDDSVQHAGLFFARHGAEGDWLNGHYGKGMPRRHPDVLRARSVPGVTGAALLVRRDAFEAVGGFCTDYVVGDYEDSDLCLRLRALGGDIRYVPAAELYHFERQSITSHAGYARTLAGAHNRRLHHLRWDAAIQALMDRFPASRARQGAAA